MTPEQYFLRYAFPCAYALVEQQRMKKEDYKKLEAAALTNKQIPFETLEPLFPAAFKRIKTTAKELNKDYKTLEVMQAYFQTEHNNFINNKDGMYAKLPKTFCEFCKVKTATIQDVKEINNQLLIKIDKNTWRVAPFIQKEDIRIGDKVTIHHAYAVELIQ